MKIATKIILCICIIFLIGCIRLRSSEIYPMAYDQTYESAITALDDMSPWKLILTDQKRGLITIGYEQYLGRKQEVTFIVERVEPFRTKISLYDRWPTHLNQKFFKAIDKYMKNRAVTYPS